MSRYNHFKEHNFKAILFKDLDVGNLFRFGRYYNGRHNFIIAIKTGDLSFIEKKSKREHILSSNERYLVYEMSNQKSE